MTRKISVSLGLLQRRHGDIFAVETAKRIGAEGIDISLSHQDYRKDTSIYSKSEEEIARYFSSVKAKAENLGLEISQTHGRFVICRSSEEETEAAIRNARFDCMAAHYLGSSYVVFHGVTKGARGAVRTDAEDHRLNELLFGRILAFAKEFDVKVAMETDDQESLFGQLDDFIASYDRICAHEAFKDRFFACVDVGHTHKSVGYGGNPGVADTIRRLGSRIGCLHLHDNNGTADEHKIPTGGSIAWKDVFNALDEVGFSGWYNLELNLKQLNDFGSGFELEYAAFAVKLLRFMLYRHYGEDSTKCSDLDNLWLSYAKMCDRIS